MGYSITFGTNEDSRNTFTNWGLLPESPPVIPTPKPKTNYIEIPGRVKGPLDMTKVPFGLQTYERITGSWNFVMYDDYWHTPTRFATFDAIRSWLHGRVTWMKLEEDPAHYYNGRFTVDPPGSAAGPFVVRINFDLEPVRYNSDLSVDSSWLPDVEDWIDSGDLPDGGIESITDPEIHALFNN